MPDFAVTWLQCRSGKPDSGLSKNLSLSASLWKLLYKPKSSFILKTEIFTSL